MARTLLGAGATVDALDRSQCTALHWVGFRGDNRRLAKLLLEAGADPKAADADGVLPVHVAVFLNHLETAEVLQKWVGSNELIRVRSCCGRIRIK